MPGVFIGPPQAVRFISTRAKLTTTPRVRSGKQAIRGGMSCALQNQDVERMVRDWAAFSKFGCANRGERPERLPGSVKSIPPGASDCADSAIGLQAYPQGEIPYPLIRTSIRRIRASLRHPTRILGSCLQEDTTPQCGTPGSTFACPHILRTRTPLRLQRPYSIALGPVDWRASRSALAARSRAVSSGSPLGPVDWRACCKANAALARASFSSFARCAAKAA